MAVRVSLLSMAHVHAPSYANCMRAINDAELTAIWDDNVERGQEFCVRHSIPFESDLDKVLEGCDAVCIAAENLKHADLMERALRAGKHVLCEKPLAGSQQEWDRIQQLISRSDKVVMTAFPCPYSPAFQSLERRLKAGELGQLVSICSTNRGTCPHSWFVDPSLSGGGALIDHTVHVGDLLYRLLGEEPVRVTASASNHMLGLTCEDCGMVTLDYASGVFVTIDASWSRTKNFKTWGDVTMHVVGSEGLIELDLFGQSLDAFTDASPSHRQLGYGSNLDMAMCNDFIQAILTGKRPIASAEDGLRASRIALAATASWISGEPVSLN